MIHFTRNAANEELAAQMVARHRTVPMVRKATDATICSASVLKISSALIGPITPTTATTAQRPGRLLHCRGYRRGRGIEAKDGHEAHEEGNVLVAVGADLREMSSLKFRCRKNHGTGGIAGEDAERRCRS